jgi:LAO/AO transport system kinase
MNLLDKFKQKDKVALSKIITLVENQSPGYQDILARLYPYTGKAYRIGITGPPGSGKSSLADRLTFNLSNQGKSVGIIAVDPTSPFTGGALLGDRIRMQDLATLKSIFIRSMASRGSMGGLASTTKEVSLVLDAFGKDYIVIETVGVGQVELDVVDTCDTTVVVFVPESGDYIQAMKAGLMEIADIFVVNKSDREGAQSMALELESILDLKRKENGWEYPVVSTQAINNIGIEKLLQKIFDHRQFVTKNGFFEKHRREQIKSEIKKLIEHKIKEITEKRVEKIFDIENIVEKILLGKDDPYSASERFLKEANLL